MNKILVVVTYLLFLPCLTSNIRRAANVLKKRADDVKKLRAFFNEFRAHNSKFYYDIEDDSEGVTKNIFRSHASCQANYAEFGDVVTFDTTYKCNFYNKPLAMFVGSNHHLQNVIFGFALLRDETEETFKWVFQTFKTCMGDKAPHSILTGIVEHFVATYMSFQPIW